MFCAAATVGRRGASYKIRHCSESAAAGDPPSGLYLFSSSRRRRVLLRTIFPRSLETRHYIMYTYILARLYHFTGVHYTLLCFFHFILVGCTRFVYDLLGRLDGI